MTDLTRGSSNPGAADDASGLLGSIRAALCRLQDWWSSQSLGTKLTLLVIGVMIPASALYSWSTLQRQEKIAGEVKAMSTTGNNGEAVWSYNTTLPVVFGTGSVLSFLEANPVARITVIYRPILWTVSERFILVESQGKQYAYYPSDMETRILTDKAVSAPWGGKLTFVPKAALDSASTEVFARLEQRFADARPQSEQDSWKAGVGTLVSASLTMGMLGFLWFQMGGQRKGLKFIRPDQIKGDISDLVGMDDIKAEVRQIRDQYERRTEYAAYGVNKPFNVMFGGPAGTGKTKLASYLAKELDLPILFHSAANLETGYVGGGSNTLSRILALAARRKRCIVFLDEAQDLFMQRGGNRKFDDDTQNMLLAVLDGVRSKSDTEIIWIVASNFNAKNLQMDEAMLRRFQMKIDFRMPNRRERVEIAEYYLGQRSEKVLPELDLRHFTDLTDGCSPADLETIVNQAGIIAVQAGELIGANTLMQAAERILVGNVNDNTTRERDRDRRIIAIHEWGHFLMDFQHERKLAQGNWDTLLAEMKIIKISLKANPRSNALGFVLHKHGNNLLQTKSDMENEVRVLLAGMANEELFFGEEGTTNGAHNDIAQVTRLLHRAVGEMGMYRKTRLNFAALTREGAEAAPDDETRSIMEVQSERLYGETKAALAPFKGLTEHLAGCLMRAGEMSLREALDQIRRFESGDVLIAASAAGYPGKNLLPAF